LQYLLFVITQLVLIYTFSTDWVFPRNPVNTHLELAVVVKPTRPGQQQLTVSKHH
jgi:hypothetical protein